MKWMPVVQVVCCAPPPPPPHLPRLSFIINSFISIAEVEFYVSVTRVKVKERNIEELNEEVEALEFKNDRQRDRVRVYPCQTRCE